MPRSVDLTLSTFLLRAATFQLPTERHVSRGPEWDSQVALIQTGEQCCLGCVCRWALGGTCEDVLWWRKPLAREQGTGRPSLLGFAHLTRRPREGRPLSAGSPGSLDADLPPPPPECSGLGRGAGLAGNGLASHHESLHPFPYPGFHEAWTWGEKCTCVPSAFGGPRPLPAVSSA